MWWPPTVGGGWGLSGRVVSTPVGGGWVASKVGSVVLGWPVGRLSGGGTGGSGGGRTGASGREMLASSMIVSLVLASGMATSGLDVVEGGRLRCRHSCWMLCSMLRATVRTCSSPSSSDSGESRSGDE